MLHFDFTLSTSQTGYIVLLISFPHLQSGQVVKLFPHSTHKGIFPQSQYKTYGALLVKHITHSSGLKIFLALLFLTFI